MAGGQARTYRPSRAASCLVLLLIAACGGAAERVPGGAADLPGPLPSGVAFAAAPESALASPDFSGELLDGTPVRASDLWDDRPLVLLFTASWCGRCEEIHREVTAVVDEHGGTIALLAVVAREDANGARQYARELDLGHPVAIADERVWLSYAADEPPLVALIAPGGKIMRGWPGGVDREILAQELELWVQEASATGG